MSIDTTDGHRYSSVLDGGPDSYEYIIGKDSNKNSSGTNNAMSRNEKMVTKDGSTAHTMN